METVSQHRRGTSRNSVIHNGVLGVLIFLATEVMLFGGLISALIVNRADYTGAWPPVDWLGVLPFTWTAINTSFLLMSGVTMYLVVREIGKSKEMDKKKVNLLLVATLFLGYLFVALQGAEWVALMSENKSMTTDLYGSFFYLIIGAHGIHALGGLFYLTAIVIKIAKASDFDLIKKSISSSSIYWYFVVGLWPILYVLVYMY
ncbi:MAG: cytochrome c oxidase subunit 3 [Leptospirales bacterium]